MMFKCRECGNLFEEGEQATWEERHGVDMRECECANKMNWRNSFERVCRKKISNRSVL